MIPEIRLHNHQLSEPLFARPDELVRWMGAIQAQEYAMAKWAVGLRLKPTEPASGEGSGPFGAVEEALRDGKIVRTHIMRPTWHFVAAEDIRWMRKLSCDRIRTTNESYGRPHGVTADLYHKCDPLIEKMLRGGNHLTAQEIGGRLVKEGVAAAEAQVRRFLMRAEVEGIVCSGADRNGKPTYALFEERIPPAAELSREEALARLARCYFRSHSPAGLNDFVWWSGLSVGEARQAIGSIDSEIICERVGSADLYLYDKRGSLVSEAPAGRSSGTGVVHLLPSFDEYLIAYKDRAAVLDPKHYSKAFNNWGIFYPVVLHGGRIVGNWTKTVKKRGVEVAVSLFEPDAHIDPAELEAAVERYRAFVS